MTRRKEERATRGPWSVPLAVAGVPESGRHLELTADEPARAAVAKLAGLRSLPRLAASFDITPWGREKLRVAGRVSATVGQVCVVSLEPVDNDVDEEIDVLFTAEASPLATEGGAETEDAPEPLVGDTIDLGAIATEFLLLALDPYPRKPGVAFEAPSPDDEGARPFAALAALKKGEHEGRG
jgi:uncharacterized metal-binding protein YceD (DUF177 family)